MLTPAEWSSIRVERVAELHKRWLNLPPQYQDWVIRSGQNRGMPTLRQNTALGPGEVQTYDVLINRCERAIAIEAKKNRSTR